MLGDEFIGTAENSYREMERQVMKLVEVEALRSLAHIVGFAMIG